MVRSKSGTNLVLVNMPATSWRVLTNDPVRNPCVGQIELQQVEELWPSRSFPDHPILFQVCRSVRSFARAFLPDPRPLRPPLHEVDSSVALVCHVRNLEFQAVQFRLGDEDESRPPKPRS